MAFWRRCTVVSQSGKAHHYVRYIESRSKNGRSKQHILVDLGNEIWIPDMIAKLCRFMGPGEFLRMALQEAELRALGVDVDKLPRGDGPGTVADDQVFPPSGGAGPADHADGDQVGDQLERQAGDDVQQLDQGDRDAG